MKKEIRSLVTKTIIFAIIVMVVSTITNAFEPLIDAKVAVQQLNGGDAGYANLSLYNSIKRFLSVGYVLFALLLYYANISRGIKYLITKNKKEEKGEQ